MFSVIELLSLLFIIIWVYFEAQSLFLPFNGDFILYFIGKLFIPIIIIGLIRELVLVNYYNYLSEYYYIIEDI